MDDELLTSDEAARKLGIAAVTLYDWLARSNASSLQICGRPVTIDYYQGGAKGQGRIRIPTREVLRLQEAMRVKPHFVPNRRPPTPRYHFPGITVELGDPDDPYPRGTPSAAQSGSW